MKDNHDNKFSTNGLDYVFSHYFGIFVTATFIFLGYAIFSWVLFSHRILEFFSRKNRPAINNEIVLPSFVSGIFWAVAQSSFFVANDNLSQTVRSLFVYQFYRIPFQVTFPIITMLPGCIASVWSIVYFKEIQVRSSVNLRWRMVQGNRNFVFLSIAMSITLCGSALVALSKTISL